MPATGNGADGAGASFQRVTAADGSSIGSAPDRFHRRSSSAVVPPASAASCNRRVAVNPARLASPMTAASDPWRRPSSITASVSASCPVSA